LIGFSAKAQFQLRPIIIKINPVSASTMELNPTTTKWIDKNYSNTGSSNPAGIGFGLSIYIPVLRSLWLGGSYSNAAYYKDGDEGNYTNGYIDKTNISGGTSIFNSGNTQSYDQYHLQKLTSYSIGLQYRPGRINKFLSPYFNLLYSIQFITRSGYTHHVDTSGYITVTNLSTSNSNSYYYDQNTHTDINNKEVYNSSGLTLGVGLDIRLSNHILLNLLEVNGSNMSGNNNHVFSLNIKSGITILLLKNK
jgi:hypothetical protein